MERSVAKPPLGIYKFKQNSYSQYTYIRTYLHNSAFRTDGTPSTNSRPFLDHAHLSFTHGAYMSCTTDILIIPNMTMFILVDMHGLLTLRLTNKSRWFKVTRSLTRSVSVQITRTANGRAGVFRKASDASIIFDHSVHILCFSILTDFRFSVKLPQSCL